MKPAGLAGTAVLVTLTDVADADRADFNSWYNREHIDDLLGLPGFRRARRYGSDAARPRFAAIYEVDDLSVLTSPDYVSLLTNLSPWSRATIARFTSHRRICCEVTVDASRGIGGAMGFIRLVGPVEADRLRRLLEGTTFPLVIERLGLHGAFFGECDLDAVNMPIRTLNLSLPEATEKECIVVIEGQDAASAAQAVGDVVSAIVTNGLADNSQVAMADTFGLYYANEKPR